MAREKLRGGWTLVRTTGGDDKNWLLIKSDDEYASKLDIVDALPDSVQSGRSLDDVAAPRAPAKRRSPLPALLKPQLATLVDAPPDGPDGCTRSNTTVIACCVVSTTATPNCTAATASR